MSDELTVNRLTIAQQAVAILDLVQGPIGEPAAQTMTRYRALTAHRDAVMEAYGAERGWTRSKAQFLPSTLAKGAMHNGGRRVDAASREMPWNLMDHVYYWKQGRRPAAIVAHPYGCNTGEKRAEAQAWAARHGLRLTFPTDFPSWRFPGWTTLVEITRADMAPTAA